MHTIFYRMHIKYIIGAVIHSLDITLAKQGTEALLVCYPTFLIQINTHALLLRFLFAFAFYLGVYSFAGRAMLTININALGTC